MTPTKLNPQVIERIAKVFRLGGTGKMAADSVGIDYRSLWRWVRAGSAEGADQTSLEYQLCQAIARAEAEAYKEALERIQSAAKDSKNWGAAAWLLERKLPDEFGRKVQVSGLAPAAYQTVMAIARDVMSTEQYGLFLDRLREAAGESLPEGDGGQTKTIEIDAG